jgi:hypothetical protein
MLRITGSSSSSSPRRTSHTTIPVRRTPPTKRRKATTKRTPPAKKRATPVKSTPPAKKQSQQQGDKYELSPNSLAKCTKCCKKIKQGEKRVGKEAYEERYSKYVHRYYHDQCFPAASKPQLKLQAGTPEKELMRADKEKNQEYSIVHRERRELHEALKTLRNGFAVALHCENQLFRVLSNKTLEQMVVKMPRNQRDMIENVFGMGPKKYESFGEAFLLVIQHYSRKYARTVPQNPKSRTSTATSASTRTGKTSSSSSNSSSSRSTTGRSRPAVALFAAAGMAHAPVVINVDADDDDDDEDVVPIESLSCTEIIKRKFDHAAANGYVISLE